MPCFLTQRNLLPAEHRFLHYEINRDEILFSKTNLDLHLETFFEQKPIHMLNTRKGDDLRISLFQMWAWMVVPH